jgi:uncharacterized protein YdeI (YjbR/CyaY-like superfamily)
VTAIYFSSPDEFRAWLEEHHASATEVLVGYWKQKTGKPSLTWSEAVDEALCYGWIDGVRRGVDDERHEQRFTPRKPSSNWSAINVAKMDKLRAEGRMREAGEAAFARRRADRTAIYAYEQRNPQLTPEEEAQFRADAEAWAYFEASPPSYRKPALWWVVSAKRPETRVRRLATLIEDSAAGQRLKRFTWPRRA